VPTLNISDKFGILLEGQADRSFSFGKYFQSLRGLNFRDLSFRRIADEFLNPSLKDFPLDEASLGASFADEIPISAGNLELLVEAGAGAGIQIVTARDENLGADQWGQPIKLQDGEAYVGFFVNAQASSGISRGIGGANFGFDISKSVRLSSFRLAGENDRFTDALRKSVESFTVVADWDDLTKLQPNVVATAEGEGTLKTSLEAKFSFAPNPLLSGELPAGGATVGITAGGSAGLKVSGSLFGGYQLRVRRIDGSRIELGYYTRKGSRLTFEMQAAAGISGGIGDRDLISFALGRISSNPKADRKALSAGGLNQSQIDRIEDMIKLGVQRKLDISLDLAFGSEQFNGEAFLFEIDTSLATSKTKKAVAAALHGDLTTVTGAVLPGVKLIRTVLSEVEKQERTLRFNLLGIYNHISISKLWLDSRITVNANGDLTFVDTATAQRAGITMTNFGANEKKLRKVMTQSFMMTAAYEASGLSPSPPKLGIDSQYFEFHSTTPSQVMKDNLDIAQALGRLHHSTKSALLRSETRDFGESTFFASVTYGNAESLSIFLKYGKARSSQQFEEAGRTAIRKLIERGDKLDYLRMFAENKSVWNEMKDIGFPGFKRVYRDHGVKLNDGQAEVLISYGVSLLDWAKAMSALSKQIIAVRKWIDDHPNEKLKGKAFQQQREKLFKRLKKVVDRSKPKWGEPVGLVSTYLALAPAARSEVPITLLVRSEELKWSG
jgi:hypothetical protein